ncbi:MAG: thiol peroxidase [Gammaproteobacteria bacterium]|jgi:thiol peroxidase|nr:thiol peroxidase [Gammaproteobacteria bacterium]
MAGVTFRGKQWNTAGDLPTVGSRAPDFRLVDGELRNLHLAHWQGRRKILNIFPSIDTPVCGQSVKVFDSHARENEDIVMLMISVDTPFAQQRFARECQLAGVETLSAIRSEGFGEHYGVLIEDGPLAGFFARAVLVLDENDTVVHRQLVEDIGDEPDYEAALRALGFEQ